MKTKDTDFLGYRKLGLQKIKVSENQDLRNQVYRKPGLKKTKVTENQD